MLRCDLQKINDELFRINFAFIPDGAVILEGWKKGEKIITIVTTSPWECKDEEDEREWRRCEYEKRQVEEFLEWLGFEPAPED